MKHVITMTAALAAMCSVTATAAAEDWGIDASVGLSHSLMRSDSINAIADHDSLAMSSIGASYRLGETRGVQLAVELDWEMGEFRGDTFQQIETDLWLRRLTAGLRATYPVTDRFAPYVRARTGVEWGTLTLTNEQSAADPIEDGARAATASLHGGAELSLTDPRHRTIAFALRLETGYTRSTALGFSAQPAAGDEDAIEISTIAASLGELDTSGWGYRISVVARF